MAKTFDITRDVLATMIIAGAIVSLFVEFNATGVELFRVMSGIVVGFYFAKREVPMGSLLTKKK